MVKLASKEISHVYPTTSGKYEVTFGHSGEYVGRYKTFLIAARYRNLYIFNRLKRKTLRLIPIIYRETEITPDTTHKGPHVIWADGTGNSYVMEKADFLGALNRPFVE